MKELLTKLKENKIDLEILSDVEGYQKIVYKKGNKKWEFRNPGRFSSDEDIKDCLNASLDKVIDGLKKEPLSILICTDCEHDLNPAFGIVSNGLAKDSFFVVGKHSIKVNYHAIVIDDRIKILFYRGGIVDKISEMHFDYFYACDIEALSFFSEKGITELCLLNDVIEKVKEYV